MLSERQLQNLLKAFDKRMQGVTDEYLTRMGEHIRDIGKLSDSDINRLVQMKRLNQNLESIKRAIAKAAGKNIRDIERVFEAVAESDYRFAAATFGEDHTPRVKDNKPLERIIKAQLRITAQEFKNLSQTTILSDAYREAVDVAVQTVQAGLTDYNSAIRKAFKQAAREGLRVEYPNSGLTRRLDTAARQNILDGVRSISQDTLNQAGKEFGADGVEISAHALCALDHLPYQGRQYSNRDFERIQNTLERPFGMWNCKHITFPILMGISQPAHTEEELQSYIRNSNQEITIDGRTMSRYEWTQHQRKLETAIRYQKDIAVAAKASGDMILRRDAQANINRIRAEYSKISAAAGLYEKPERMTVAGFRAVKTADQLKNPPKDDKMEVSTKASGDGVNFVCKIDKKIYSCITKDIITDEVIITDERIDHSNKHSNAYDKFADIIPKALAKPDYIFEDNKRPNTGMVIKRIIDERGHQLQIILRMKVESDPIGYKNSIISCWDISQSRFENYKNNRKILYKDPEI